MNMQEDIWNNPPAQIALKGDEVHVWRVSLDRPQTTIERLSRLLVADELAKAGRFRFAKDRNQFIIGRGLLRVLLGRYFACEPAQIRFCYSSYGKPSLEDGTQAGLQFNLSHSHQMALLAFTRDRNVGVDIEYMRPDVEFEQLAQHFFSPTECAVLLDVVPVLRKETFYNCWTRKEAYIKARGEGLSMPLDLFDVSLRPGEPAALLQCRENPAEVARWSLHALMPGEQYAAALAVEKTCKYTEQRILCWDWSEEAKLW
ncbi:4'-phosphopantetheinyl transferase [Reticulibacter mediterranei]|uniref:4'-phosphopantetheinyl transferase n=1 Tax=Reticulibacter mediterranei TaxID=2778369 RepID=A0A8J3IJL8_9CHLR|nr:4'-phosphopantetheinyl transferase superfamily protein [Reticulibacter mediterranei]GHO91995.1 4'-phosphopantetheinyl transferase [Reticulibacter mediterranei]